MCMQSGILEATTTVVLELLVLCLRMFNRHRSSTVLWTYDCLWLRWMVDLHVWATEQDDNEGNRSANCRCRHREMEPFARLLPHQRRLPVSHRAENSTRSSQLVRGRHVQRNEAMHTVSSGSKVALSSCDVVANRQRGIRVEYSRLRKHVARATVRQPAGWLDRPNSTSPRRAINNNESNNELCSLATALCWAWAVTWNHTSLLLLLQLV